MKTLIHEIGVIDKQGVKHPVSFKKGLNVVTGKSSTGKSALIEIFDYCFGSEENTIPKGVITTHAAIYYVGLSINEKDIILARDPQISTKAFLRRIESFNSEIITSDYFNHSYFRPLSDFKKHLRSFFLDIDDVDESLAARENRRFKAKAATPSIRSLTSFILQHQNLVANKHAIFYRFDEKEKRDQVIDHIKIFLGLVDQKYFHLSQERERLNNEINQLKRQYEANKQAAESYKDRVGPVLTQLYAMMGFNDAPLSLQKILRNPQNAKDELDLIIVPEKIKYDSNAITQRYDQLTLKRTEKLVELRKLQRQISSIKKHIHEEERFVDNISKYSSPKDVCISTSVCPFCHTVHETLNESAENLKQAIIKVSGNLELARPMKAKFESSLIEVKRSLEKHEKELEELNQQINEIELMEKRLKKQKSLYENILIQKAKLFILLDTLNLANDIKLEEKIKELNKRFMEINNSLKNYNVSKGLNDAADKVNKYMAEIGSNFEFEESYKPINLHFSLALLHK
ncbi:DUF3732 domain-containing protein, partial [Acinetobacter sp. HR7]|uniref:DUF3732 domain-containing protein n=1 Tax=Acinetobacter sp. HR7 TaxID=1509403 RepID=UPI00055905AD